MKQNYPRHRQKCAESSGDFLAICAAAMGNAKKTVHNVTSNLNKCQRQICLFSGDPDDDVNLRECRHRLTGSSSIQLSPMPVATLINGFLIGCPAKCDCDGYFLVSHRAK